MGLKGMLLKGSVNFITVIADLRVSCAQVEIAEVKIHGFVKGKWVWARKTALNQWIGVFQLRPLK